jgi:hypothetical protein
MMPSILETHTTQADMRKRSDLPSQYRPIGIGAVAAALVAAGREGKGATQAASNSNAPHSGDSLAA